MAQTQIAHLLCLNRVSELGQQHGHMELGPGLKVSSERLEKRGVDLAIPGLVVWLVIHYTTAPPA